jgi:Flp pilus assembly protein TadG
MDCSRALYAYHFISYAAQEGTRYAIVRGANFKGVSCSTTSTQACDATADDIQKYVRGIAPPSVTSTSLTVTTTWPGTNISGSSTACKIVNNQGCLVKVTISYPFSFLLPFLPGSPMTFSASSEQAIQE